MDELFNTQSMTDGTSPGRNWANHRAWPYLLIGLAVILRLIHIWNSRHNPTFWAPAVDPGWYDQAAQDILRGHWGPFPFFRAPAYPALLAIVYGVFGHDLVAARILNVVLQGITIWAVWRVGKAYFSSAVGVLAAMLLAVNGTMIYFACELVSTSLEMLVATLAVWAAFRLTHDHSPAALLICGMAWGISAVVRPNFLFALPAVGFFVLWQFGSPREWLRNLKSALAAGLIWVAGVLLPILPITAVNYIRGGEFVPIATQGGVNFWIGNNPESTGILSVLPGYGNTWTMEDAQYAAEEDVGRPLRPGELSSYYYSKGWSFLAQNPLLSVRFMIRKTLLFFNRFEISNNKHIEYFSALTPWLPPLHYLNFGLLLPLGLLGAWTSCREKREAGLLAALILFYAASVILFFITARFRMPTVPWLSLLAAGGLVWIADVFRRKPNPRALAPLIVLPLGAALAFMNPWNLKEAPRGWARYMEGNAFMKLGQLDEARAAFLDALHDNQAPVRTQINLGVIAYRKGDHAEAKSWYAGAIAADSSAVDAWNNLGTVSEADGDTTKAIECYTRALSLKPNAPDPRHNLAAIHFRIGVAALKQGADSRAVEHLEECLTLLPTAIVHYDLAIALGRLGRNDAALSHLGKSLELDPGLTAARDLQERLRNQPPASPANGAAAPNPD